MLKYFLTILITSSYMMGIAYADDNTAQNPYVAKMQQTFDNASAKAKAQFDKTFPKPVAPVLDNSNNKLPTATSATPKTNTQSSSYNNRINSNLPANNNVVQTNQNQNNSAYTFNNRISRTTSSPRANRT